MLCFTAGKRPFLGVAHSHTAKWPQLLLFKLYLLSHSLPPKAKVLLIVVIFTWFTFDKLPTLYLYRLQSQCCCDPHHHHLLTTGCGCFINSTKIIFLASRFVMFYHFKHSYPCCCLYSASTRTTTRTTTITTTTTTTSILTLAAACTLPPLHPHLTPCVETCQKVSMVKSLFMPIIDQSHFQPMSY